LVPPGLDAELRQALEIADDPLSISYRAALCILRQYLGADWTDRYVRLRDPHDRFMLNEFDEASESRWIHQKRVVTMGDALFGLRSVEGFNHMVRRLRQREIRSCYFEALTAANFVDDGFHVAITQETGQLGSDFDFSVARNSQTIAVEVTAKKKGVLTSQTILNTLRQKRVQFPQDRPAILFVIIPDNWALGGSESEEIIVETTTRFLARDTRRINAVVYSWSCTMPAPDGGRLTAEVVRPFFNGDPRHPIGNVDFLTPNHIGDLHSLLAAFAIDASNVVRTVGETSIMPRFWDHYGAVE
jgi:hypothetical protein